MTKNVMKVTAVGDTGEHKCECEHGGCLHDDIMSADSSCIHWALTRVYFAGAGSFWLCDACLGTYMADGFELIP